MSYRIAYLEPAAVLVCGSTLFACQTALEAARAGHRTVLAMARLHPFHEAINCLNPWLDGDRAEAHSALLATTLRAPELTSRDGDRLYFNATEAAVEIEDRLLEAGVRMLYNAPVAGALTHEGRLGGVVFGGKPGLFAVEGALFIDATVHATVARALGLPEVLARPAADHERVCYSVERCRSKPSETFTERFRAANGFAVTAENRNRYTHYTMDFPARPRQPLSDAEIFRDVYAAALEYAPNLPSGQFRGADGCLRRGHHRIAAVEGAVAGHDNLRVFSPMGLPDNPSGQLALLDHTYLFEAFPRALREDVLQSVAARKPPGERPCYAFANRAIGSAASATGVEHGFTDADAAFPGMRGGQMCFVPPVPTPARELTVVGGGTSGIAAAIQAADLGIDTLCLDGAGELGGTNTVGGVNSLWFGRKIRGFAEYFRGAGAVNDGLNAPPFFCRANASPQLTVLLLTPVCGIARRGRRLCAVHVVTPLGLASIGVGQVIDATGDGSLAAWAGCAHHFGSERDGHTLWASLGSYAPGRAEGRRQFLTPLDERAPEDTARVVQAMRRYQQRGASPAFLLTPRESRHLHAAKRLTFLDTVAGRRFRDGILRFQANPDIKGNTSSDLAHAGLLTGERFRVFEATLPYAALVPGAIDNLLVVGKAYAATSDALSMARMQRDLALLGRAAAHAMAQCTRQGITPRAVDLARLQQALVRDGILAPGDLAADDLGVTESPAELFARIAAATDLEDSLEPTARLLLLHREHELDCPDAADVANPSVARLLCLAGDTRGIARYRQRLGDWLDRLAAGIPEADRWPDAMRHGLPDHGFAPQPLYWLMALAQQRCADVPGACARIAAAVAQDEQLNANTLWSYAFAVGYSCERLATSACVPPLVTLLDSSHFRHTMLLRGGDLRQSLDTPRERRDYLRLGLLRALARAGHPRGHGGLTEYLQSAHAGYARHARDELRELTGQDFGFAPDAWRAWLGEHADALAPRPYDRRLD